VDFDFLYELLVYARDELRKAVADKDWERVKRVQRRIEDEIGYK